MVVTSIVTMVYKPTYNWGGTTLQLIFLQPSNQDNDLAIKNRLGFTTEKNRALPKERCVNPSITIWLFNIAMENHGKSQFLIGKPSINGPFSMAMLNNQRVNLNSVTVKTLLTWIKNPKLYIDIVSLTQFWWFLSIFPIQNTKNTSHVYHQLAFPSRSARWNQL